MTWSHPHDGRFYLVLALGLAGFLVVAWRLAAVPGAPRQSAAGSPPLALGVLVLILLNPVSRSIRPVPGSGTGRHLPDR